MNQQIKEQWVAALRSGHYEQTRNVLHDTSGFCCLGVLSDLYLKEVGKEWGVIAENYFMFPDSVDEVLPKEVMDWADLSWDNPEVTVERFSPISGQNVSRKIPLSDLNDTDHNFNMIAALIEEQL